jgi:lactate racemase
MAKDYHLYLGQNRKEFFALPSAWTVIHPSEDEDQGSPDAPEVLARKAIATPVGCPPLEVMAAKARQIAIVVDDSTRPTPVQSILSVLLDKLKDAGVPHGAIRIVVALGSHGSMTKEALAARLGADAVSRHRVVQHNAWQAKLIHLEVPRAEMVVKVNPAVTEAELKIGISSILPHPFAGFGGGPKILMPGVCDAESLARHHMMLAIHPRARLGVTEGNPFHESCMEVARAIGLDFSINCVYDKQGVLSAIIGGSLEAAFGEAVKVCRKTLGHRLEEKVDVTISSTYPHTHGIQFCKGLCAPGMITRTSGAILLNAPLMGRLPEEFVTSVAGLRERYGDAVGRGLRDIMSEGKLVLDDKSPEYNMALYDLLGRPRARTLLVSPTVPPHAVSRLGMESVPSVEEGVRLLEQSYPTANVAVFPSGGLVVPIGDWM